MSTPSDIHQKVQICIYKEAATQKQILRLRANPARGHFWQNITGSVEAGEDLATAALREIKEEIGVSSQIENLKKSFKILQFTDQYSRAVEEHLFTLKINSNQDIKLSDEHDLFEWVSSDQLTPSHFKFESHFELAQEIL